MYKRIYKQIYKQIHVYKLFSLTQQHIYIIFINFKQNGMTSTKINKIVMVGGVLVQ